MFGTFTGSKFLRHILAALFLTLALAAPARAATVLLYIDLVLGTNYVVPALAGNTVTTAVSWADFNTKLAGGGYQLAIALNQNSTLGADLPTLTNYVAGGGRVIFADWTQTASFATVLNGGYTGVINQLSLNFTNPSLAAGITNPQPLTNPGWGTFSMGESVGGGGVSACLFPNGNSCVVVGNGGRTLLLGFLSDTPSAADGVRLWQNLIGFALNGVIVPQLVPTLSQWALVALALVLMGLGVVQLRRRT